MSQNLLSVILPTYNEAENIVSLIREIVEILERENLNFEILVVDDNSPDGTALRVKDTFKNGRIKLFVRRKDRSLAGSIREGIEKSSGNLILIMDTDFNHNPLYIPQMLKILPEYDIVIGSRYVRGGGMPISTSRYFISLFSNMFLRIVLRLPYRDTLSGFLLFRKNLLYGIHKDKIFHGYGDYSIRLLYWIKLRKARVKEIPVVYGQRGGGMSKTNLFKVGLQYLITVFDILKNKRIYLGAQQALPEKHSSYQ